MINTYEQYIIAHIASSLSKDGFLFFQYFQITIVIYFLYLMLFKMSVFLLKKIVSKNNLVQFMEKYCKLKRQLS